MNDLKTIEDIKDALEALLAIPPEERDQAIWEEILYLVNLINPDVKDDTNKESTDFFDAEETLGNSTNIEYAPLIQELENDTTPLLYSEHYKLESDDDLIILESSPANNAPIVYAETFTLKAINTAEFRIFTNPTPASGDFAGRSIAMNNDYLVIGSDLDDVDAADSGAVYIHDAITGALLRTISNPSIAADTRFGISLSVNNDNIALIGASYNDTGFTNSGQAYIIDITTGNLLHTLNNPTPGTNEYFGTTTFINGNYAIVGAYNNAIATTAGSAYIYDVTTGSLLFTLNGPTPTTGDGFAVNSVSIDGNYALIGATAKDIAGIGDAGSNAGVAYIYNVTTGNLVHTIYNPAPALNDYFGISTAIKGNYAIIGAANEDTNGTSSGSAYIFNVTTGNLIHTISNPDPAAYDYFGQYVAIHGNYAIISAIGDDTGVSYAGAAYIYDIITGALLYTINNPTPEINDSFGSDIDMSDNAAIISANSDDTGALNAGSTYMIHGDFDSDGEVRGSASNDTLYGFDGNDILYGLGGHDTLYGGAGADTFKFESQGAADFDRIEDFDAGDGDILDISDLLTGFDGNIEYYARIIDDTVNAGHAYLLIDENGASDGQLDFTAIAYIINGAGLDISTLFDNNQVIAV